MDKLPDLQREGYAPSAIPSDHRAGTTGEPKNTIFAGHNSALDFSHQENDFYIHGPSSSSLPDTDQARRLWEFNRRTLNYGPRTVISNDEEECEAHSLHDPANESLVRPRKRRRRDDTTAVLLTCKLPRLHPDTGEVCYRNADGALSTNPEDGPVCICGRQYTMETQDEGEYKQKKAHNKRGWKLYRHLRQEEHFARCESAEGREEFSEFYNKRGNRNWQGSEIGSLSILERLHPSSIDKIPPGEEPEERDGTHRSGSKAGMNYLVDQRLVSQWLNLENSRTPYQWPGVNFSVCFKGSQKCLVYLSTWNARLRHEHESHRLKYSWRCTCGGTECQALAKERWPLDWDGHGASCACGTCEANRAVAMQKHNAIDWDASAHPGTCICPTCMPVIRAMIAATMRAGKDAVAKVATKSRLKPVEVHDPGWQPTPARETGDSKDETPTTKKRQLYRKHKNGGTTTSQDNKFSASNVADPKIESVLKHLKLDRKRARLKLRNWASMPTKFRDLPEIYGDIETLDLHEYIDGLNRFLTLDGNDNG